MCLLNVQKNETGDSFIARNVHISFAVLFLFLGNNKQSIPGENRIARMPLLHVLRKCGSFAQPLPFRIATQDCPPSLLCRLLGLESYFASSSDERHLLSSLRAFAASVVIAPAIRRCVHRVRCREGEPFPRCGESEGNKWKMCPRDLLC